MKLNFLTHESAYNLKIVNVEMKVAYKLVIWNVLALEVLQIWFQR
jgi:hypothetical protein